MVKGTKVKNLSDKAGVVVGLDEKVTAEKGKPYYDVLLEGMTLPSLHAESSLTPLPSKKERNRQLKLELDSAIANIVLEVMDEFIKVQGTPGVEIGGADFTNVATLVAVRRGIMAPEFSSTAKMVAQYYGIELPTYLIMSNVSTMPGRLEAAKVVQKTPTGYIRTGAAFAGFTE